MLLALFMTWLGFIKDNPTWISILNFVIFVPKSHDQIIIIIIIIITISYRLKVEQYFV
jgi:hypothetical protein